MWKFGKTSDSALTEKTPETPEMDENLLLSVEDLCVHWPTDDGLVKSVDHLSFRLERGKTLGIVGESGSGKSVTASAIMGLHRGSNARVKGGIFYNGPDKKAPVEDLLRVSDARMRKLRGKELAMVFQDPLSSFHPYYTVGEQIIEGYQVHHPSATKKQARQRAIDFLGHVGIPSPRRRVDQYPHEFSGGMRQRAMVAMSLVNDPTLLIADEPTTALDVTVQAQILQLMLDLQDEFGSAIILITHDLGVVAETVDDVLVMYAGRPVERGSVWDVFDNPEHPYTWGLLNSMPRLDLQRQERLDPIPGNPPSLIGLPDGCAFQERCTYSDQVPDRKCFTTMPELREHNGHLARCYLDPEQKSLIRNHAGDPEGESA